MPLKLSRFTDDQGRRAIDQPGWVREVFNRHARNYVLHGGRGSGKTVNVALELLRQARNRRGLRVLCLRETQDSLEESVYSTLVDCIGELGWQKRFNVQASRILMPGGGRFVFKGMSGSHGTSRSIQSFNSVDYCWFEQAEQCSEESLRLLRPTIRAPGSSLIFTLNPKERDGAIYRRYVLDDDQDADSGWDGEGEWAIVRQVNYDSNKFFDQVPELVSERLFDFRNDPAMYPHTWLGQPVEDGSVRRVLPHDLIEACIIEPPVEIEGRVDAGLDVADVEEGDRNALALRRGPLLEGVSVWAAATLGETTRRAHSACVEHGARILHYDSGGPGAGVRSHLVDLGRQGERIPYYPEGINFGSAVAGGETYYAHGVRNRDHFARRNMQMAWALRQRAQRTRMLLSGADIDPDTCLFIDPGIERRAELVRQLTQPVWREDTSGRMVLAKAPGNASSPDMFDAVCLAFASDSKGGLVAGRV